MISTPVKAMNGTESKRKLATVLVNLLNLKGLKAEIITSDSNQIGFKVPFENGTEACIQLEKFGFIIEYDIATKSDCQVKISRIFGRSGVFTFLIATADGERKISTCEEIASGKLLNLTRKLPVKFKRNINKTESKCNSDELDQLKNEINHRLSKYETIVSGTFKTRYYKDHDMFTLTVVETSEDFYKVTLTYQYFD